LQVEASIIIAGRFDRVNRNCREITVMGKMPIRQNLPALEKRANALEIAG
jgi:hypothetical protein